MVESWVPSPRLKLKQRRGFSPKKLLKECLRDESWQLFLGHSFFNIIMREFRSFVYFSSFATHLLISDLVLLLQTLLMVNTFDLKSSHKDVRL